VIVEKCLRKNPDERYANVAELARALEPYGPASVKTSVERITRLTASRPGAVRSPEPSVLEAPVSIVARGQTAASVSSLGRTELSGSTESFVATDKTLPVPQAVPGAGTAAAWGSSRAAQRSSRLPVILGSAGAVGVLAVIALVFAFHKSPPPAPVVSHEPAPTTPVVVATPEPTTTTPPSVEAPFVAPPAASSVTSSPPLHPAVATAKPATSTAKPATTAKKPVVDTMGFGDRN
jgi:serine/threonine-protein kinase